MRAEGQLSFEEHTLEQRYMPEHVQEFGWMFIDSQTHSNTCSVLFYLITLLFPVVLIRCKPGLGSLPVYPVMKDQMKEPEPTMKPH